MYGQRLWIYEQIHRHKLQYRINSIFFRCTCFGNRPFTLWLIIICSREMYVVMLLESQRANRFILIPFCLGVFKSVMFLSLAERYWSQEWHYGKPSIGVIQYFWQIANTNVVSCHCICAKRKSTIIIFSKTHRHLCQPTRRHATIPRMGKLHRKRSISYCWS